MRRIALVALLALLPASGSRAVECAYLHPDFAKLPEGRARAVLLSPRVEIVDSHGNVAEDPGAIARALVPQIHGRLEMLGFQVDARSLRDEALARDSTKRALVERAWAELARTSGSACVPDASVDPESLTLSDAVLPLGVPLKADVLVLTSARTVVRSRKLKAFLRTIQTVAPDARWPGPQTDVTWVEVCLADAHTGRVLALYGVAEEGDVSRHPVTVASHAIDRALADLPSPGAAVPSEPSRVIYESMALSHWLRVTGSELTERAATTRNRGSAMQRPEDVPQARGMECAAVSSGARIVLSRRSGVSALLVVNEMQRPVRVSASLGPLIDLEPGDAVLLDVDESAPWLLVEDPEGADLARIDCAEALASHVQARILPP